MGLVDAQTFFAAYRSEIAAMRKRAGRSTDVIAPIFVTEERYQWLLEAGTCVLVKDQHLDAARASYDGQPDPRGEGPAPDRTRAVITFVL